MLNDYSYLEKLIISTFESHIDNLDLLFFNTTEQKYISELISESINDANTLFFEESIKYKECTDPYFPFLNFIKDYLNKNKVNTDKFVNKADVFYFHSDIFKNYFLNKELSRHEEIIPFKDEIADEQHHIMKSIISLFSKINSDNIVVLVKNLHLASKSTLDFIKYISINKQYIKIKNKITFIFSFDKNCKFTSKVDDFCWKNFLDEISNMYSIFDFKPSINTSIIEIKEQVCEINKTLSICKTNFYFLALEETRYFLIKIYNTIFSNDKFKNVRVEVLSLLGATFNYLQESELSLNYYYHLIDIIQKEDNLPLLAEMYKKIGFVFFLKNDFTSCTRFTAQSVKIALDSGDEVRIALSYFLMFILDSSLGEQNDSYFEELIHLLTKHKLYNRLSYLFSNLDYLFYINQHSYDEAMEKCNASIKISKKTKHIYRLSAGYHVLAILYSFKKQFTLANKYYKKCESIRKNLGSDIELVKIYNGVGYYYFSNEDYIKAHKYYNKAVTLLEKVQDYTEICSTLYNLSIVYLFINKITTAIDFLENTLYLMNILKIKNLFLKSKFKIYCVLGIAYMKIKNSQKAIEYLNLAKSLNDDLDFEAISYFELLQALIAKNSKEFKLAKAHFLKTIALIVDNNIENFEHMLIKYYYEYALFLLEIDSKKEAKKVLNEALVLSKLNNFGYDIELINSLLENKKFNPKPLKLNLENFSMNLIIESAKKLVDLAKLHKKVNEMNFLNSIQNTLAEVNKKSDLLDSVMNILNNNFVCQFVGVFTRSNKNWECLYASKPIDSLNLPIDTFLNLLLKGQNDLIIPQISTHSELKKICKSLNSIICIPFKEKRKIVGCMIYATEDKNLYFSHDDLQPLSIASKQLFAAFERIELLDTQASQLEYIKMAKTTLENTLEKLNIKTIDLKNLLNNVGQGFLLLNKDLLINEDYSHECVRIFGFELANLKFPDIIYPTSSNEQSFLYNALKYILNEQNITKIPMLIELLPKETKINKKNITIQYKIINSTVSERKIMVILTDITEKKILESQVEKERNILKMVVNVATNFSDFMELLEDYYDFYNLEIKEILDNKPAFEASFEIYRAIHTFKGNFNQLYLINVVKKLHCYESEISDFMKNLDKISHEEIYQFFITHNILEWIQSDLNILKEILGEEMFNNKDTLNISKHDLIFIEERATKILNSKQTEELLPLLKQLRYKNFKKLLIPYIGYSLKLADRLDKMINEFTIEGDDILIDPEIYHDFIRSLVNIFRNILDHGIESIEQRIEKDKDEYGNIKCSVKLNTNKIHLIISDDGNGIDIEKIKATAFKKSIATKSELDSMNSSQLLDLIFVENFSTANKVTETSGRGMGMSAVKSEVNKLNGTIKISSIKDVGTTFEFIFPISNPEMYYI